MLHTNNKLTLFTDLKPPTELVQKLIEMGFPRVQCDKAVEATKATTVDDAVAWIIANKPVSFLFHLYYYIIMFTHLLFIEIVSTTN